MKILFVIAVISFAALVWAGLAIMRHVRKNSARAAAQPAADAEMSEAIDVRLSSLARQSSSERAAPAAVESQQDFSYFNRDGSSTSTEHKPYVSPASPIKPAVVDRP